MSVNFCRGGYYPTASNRRINVGRMICAPIRPLRLPLVGTSPKGEASYDTNLGETLALPPGELSALWAD